MNPGPTGLKRKDLISEDQYFEVLNSLPAGNDRLPENDPNKFYARIGGDAVKELLYKEYSDSMSMEDAIKMCIRALKKVLGKDFDARRIDGAYVDIKEKNYQLIDKKKFRV